MNSPNNLDTLPDGTLECILLKSLSPNASLTQLVLKGFVSNRWLEIVSHLIRKGWLGFGNLQRGNTLKLFDNELQVSVYQKQVVKDAKLYHNEPQMKINRAQPRNWRHQDHIFLSDIADTSLDVLLQGLAYLFYHPPPLPHHQPQPQPASYITSLVVGTPWVKFNIFELLEAFSSVVSLTLFEFPDNHELQNKLWQYLATREPHIQRLHIFHRNGRFPLDAAQVAPTFSRLQSLTLHQYKYTNQATLVSTLRGTICRQIRIYDKLNGRGQNCKQQWQRRWWVEGIVFGFRGNDGDGAPHEWTTAKSKWRMEELKFMLNNAVFRKHWRTRIIHLEPGEKLVLEFMQHQVMGNAPWRLSIAMWMRLMTKHEWAVRVWDHGGRPPFEAVPPVEEIPVPAPDLLSYLPFSHAKRRALPSSSPPSPVLSDTENALPSFVLSSIHVIYVTLWLKKMACLVGFGAADPSVASERDFLGLLYPPSSAYSRHYVLRGRRPEILPHTVNNPHRQLQRLVHLWRALIRKLNQKVKLWMEEEKRKSLQNGDSQKVVSITKSKLFGLFADLYYQLVIGNWKPPLPFYYHPPTQTENAPDPLKPWMVIWTMIHDYSFEFEIGEEEGGTEKPNNQEECNVSNSTAYFLHSENGKCSNIGKWLIDTLTLL